MRSFLEFAVPVRRLAALALLMAAVAVRPSAAPAVQADRRPEYTLEEMEALLSKAKESVLRALRPGTRPKRHLGSRGRFIEALLDLKLDIRVLIRIFRKVSEVSRRYAELDRTLLRIRGGAGLPRERLTREYERLRRITQNEPDHARRYDVSAGRRGGGRRHG